jgi:hypothetical protein
MKTRFATPEERDVRFVRYTGFRPSDFGREVKAGDSIADLAVVAALALAVLVMIAT